MASPFAEQQLLADTLLTRRSTDFQCSTVNLPLLSQSACLLLLPLPFGKYQFFFVRIANF
jgi:hypothetical protein